MMNKAKFHFVLVVWASLALVIFSTTTSSGDDYNYDFIPSEIAEGWTCEPFLVVPYLAGAIAFDANDSFYTTNLAEEYSGDHITVYKYAAPEYDFSNPSIYASYPKTFDTTSGIDFDDKGNLFVSEIVQSSNLSDYENAGLIRKIHAGNLQPSEPIIFVGIPNVPGDGDFRPTGIAATGNQTVYFPGRQWSKPEWGKIYKIESFKKYVLGTEPSIVRDNLVMFAIADNKWGQIFVADYSIYTRNPYTNTVVTIAGFDEPKYVEEMAFDSAGNLYAVEGDDNPGPYEVEVLKIIPPHIIISGCNTGIIDWPIQDGSTFGGLIEDNCADIPLTNGNFVNCIVSYAVDFRKKGLISPQQMASIITCADKANVP